MTFKIFLAEIPQIIPPEDFDLSDETENRKACAILLKDYKLKLLSDDFKHGSKLYTIKNAIFLENGGLLVYYVKYETNNYKLINKPVISQTVLWRKRGLDVTTDSIGMPTRVFFDCVLNLTGIVATDKQQTEQGRDFWFDRIAQAYDRNYHVYFLSVLYLHELRELKTYQEFTDLLNNNVIWGDNNKHQFKKIIISKEN